MSIALNLKSVAYNLFDWLTLFCSPLYTVILSRLRFDSLCIEHCCAYNRALPSAARLV